MLWWDPINIIFIAIILCVSIWLHEYAHARTSYKLGDPTPKIQGRLTPNPIAHLDPIGFVMIFLIWFGRGKPVQVNPNYYKKPIQWELIVALAWPATNIVLATIGIAIILLYAAISGLQQTEILLWWWNIIIKFWTLFSFINIALAVFNMIPLPPLDGFRIIKTFVPKLWRYMMRYSLYISIAFLILILGPGRWMIWWFIQWVSQTIFTILYTLMSVIFY
jgi:Zn-dependent protease